MTNNKFNMKQVKRTAVAVAVGMCFASMAYAQNADGTIYGRTKPNEQVQVVSTENGSTRTISADKNGGFSFSKLPPGQYKVTSGGKTRDVSVAIGSGSEVKFDDVAVVTVTGSRTRATIDVSSVESNTVFSLAEIQRLPVGRSPTSVALLAPGTVKGESGFGNLASFGGASVAENGYYINGFDVTNIRNFTNYAQLPFDAIGQQQIKTGGYGAEFGRSLGGVVSMTTKRGTNNWKGGVSLYMSNSAFSAQGKNVKNLDPEANEEFQKYTVYNSPENSFNNINMNAYIGGPIIKDKLFVFALIDGKRNKSHTFGEGTSRIGSNETPNGMLKLDWQINDSHRLEYTGISNKQTAKTVTYENEEISDKYSPRHIGVGHETSTKSGGDVNILKYTGYLTDNLTLTSQIGRVNNLQGKLIDPAAFGENCPAVYTFNFTPIGCWNYNRFTLPDPKAPDTSDTRKAKRIDLEYTFGDHLIRAGWDAQDFISTNQGVTYSGGVYYLYPRVPASGVINGTQTGLPAGTEVLRRRIYQTTTGAFLVKNDAFYVENTWKATKNFILYGGLRSESFDNKNADGISFIKKDNLIAPRLGASWNVNGDSSFKVYANAGRYYIPVAANTNIRATGAEYYEQRFFTYTGKDPVTQAPITIGPEIGTGIVNGSYKAPNPGTIADTKLSPMNQDEFIIGFQKLVGNQWTFGMKGVSRKINSGMDDYCSAGGINKWAKDQGYTKFDWHTLAGCMVVNPGSDLNLMVDVNNDGKLVPSVIPNSYLGLAKYARTYKALEFSLERPFDGKWGMSSSYVYSVNKGSAEGYVQSDLVQGDAGITQDFDFGSFTDGAYGRLPNDRTHQLKIYGNYALNDRVRFGANFNLASGRATSCVGYVPTTVPDYYGPDGKSPSGGAGAYGSASSYYCLNKDGKSVLGSRGNGPETPWTKTLDVNASYNLALNGGQTLTFQFDIFNLFNTQTVTNIDQQRDYDRPSTLLATGNRFNLNYGQPTGFTAARSARVTARYAF